MSGIEIASYMIAVVYVVSFLAMSAILAREADRPIWLFSMGSQKQALPAMLFRLAFVGAILWPLALAAFGNPLPGDPVPRMLDSVWADAFGHLLVVLGACLAILAQRHMGRSWRIGAAEGEIGTIVDSGPFAMSRNPVFVGQALLFGGLLFVLPSLVQAAITLALLIAIQLQVAIEERVLEADLGNPYRAYKQRVHRWLGSSGLKTEGT
ncbi:protein-S-isoprenylcysteine O-methyltransferase Ste14 [Bosea sp. BE271]|uniref:methyltransferase family protein n=1 Tax=Bosea TaxID=85413 RepID=UPI00285DE508|nr:MULTISPECIES: isoprenylcysteine carboxylmethyltransferase family protein [Bosea]MDR6826333.1 protein-S-isoprenylcysteine O-methyltransferase Ste14 [Bosea robiniae]MDR6893043.1 protein-S-isoprenylcysteine O-methyltransferase Ste14 [Bosea sp. BE109]MDR7137259.1 protein-S-isoprenylcysteine O-methyltransferase Ste14 [Bosea sp. BE168]MDR7173959.1 protein-S-isoprenylcysteine O-methyltransferase Ste14 [Bosea sp. BE271]